MYKVRVSKVHVYLCKCLRPGIDSKALLPSVLISLIATLQTCYIYIYIYIHVYNNYTLYLGDYKGIVETTKSFNSTYTYAHNNLKYKCYSFII